MNDFSKLNLGELLNRFKGKDVSLLLNNGTTISGKLKGELDYSSPLLKMIHVEKLEREDYFDCILVKDHICGIKFRTE
jgi:hypothetical protein